jgi:hypothetical protein
MWKNIVKPGTQQVTIWRMRFACWIPKATNTHSKYVTRIAFAQQQWLHELASLLPYTCTVCLVMPVNISLGTDRILAWVQTEYFSQCNARLRTEVLGFDFLQ